ncbi:unnamed protein product [Hyaloperonospora brassicae]|uniref:Uncharacterized protein n=1 Tax=Hyaloperonospora brassicae TaxID=162125 RepID=A0AAV0T339_HYABA|nr:unnamed protein product [Hyaloperonospora brassicae]
MKSLVELSVTAVAHLTPVPELLANVEYLPTAVRHELFHELSDCRLRQMEMAWEAAARAEAQEPRDGFDPLAGDQFLFDRETQREWERRLRTAQRSCGTRVMTRTANPVENSAAAQERRRNYRFVFWEHQFRTLFNLRNPQRSTDPVDVLSDCQELFADVVEVLKVHGRELCDDNVQLISALRQLRRLEIHHPEQQRTCWETTGRLLQSHQHLTELGLFHGKLTDTHVAQMRTTLAKPTSTVETGLGTSKLTSLDLVSVKLRPEGYRQLVRLVADMPHLLQLRLSNSISDLDANLIVDAAFRAPKLERLFLEHNELDDSAFIGLATVRQPLALRHLRLSDNDVSATTVGAICRASMDGVLNLDRLELANNLQMGDPGIHALTPMLASPDVRPAVVLTHLDVRSCDCGLDGVTNLLLALGHNKTVTHLNVAQNFFDVGFGDVLAEFLSTNDSVTHLQVNGVGLGLAGVSARLLTAVESNMALTSFSVGANRLRNDGAIALLRALVKRARTKPFKLVDLSGNLLTVSGLATIADMMRQPFDVTATHSNVAAREDATRVDRKRRRIDSPDKRQDSSSPHNATDVLFEELCLLNNDFVGKDEQGTDSSIFMESIRRSVGHLRSNEWATRHQVYDDEV